MSEIFNLTERARTAISLGESHFREFKSALEGRPGDKKGRQLDEIARDIAEGLVAFANADGGELIVGVEDDGELTGVNHLAETNLKSILDAPKDKVHRDTPLSSVRSARLSIDTKTILYFSVPKSTSFIHLTSKGHCMQRRDLETVPVPPDQITFERREQTSREYDRQFVDGASADALDTELVRVVADQISPGMSPERCLQYLDLAEYIGPGLRLKRAALLLFARESQRWHPRLQIRIMKVQGTEVLTGDRYNVVSDNILTANIIKLIEKGWENLRPHLVQTRLGESARFESTVMYPELACREALVNAIAHRDYSDEGRGIEIYVYQDRMEVRSPGALLSSIKIADLLRLEGVHQSRNSLVSRVLRELGYMRELGEGLRRIFNLMQKNELTPPELNNTSTSFSLSLHHKTVYAPEELLWLEQFLHLGLNHEQKAVVVMGKGNRLIAPQDIWDNLGIVDTEHYRQLIASLQEIDIIFTAVSKTAAYNKAKSRGLPVRKIPRLGIKLPTNPKGSGRGVIQTADKQSQPSASEKKEMIDDSPNPNARVWIGNLPSEMKESELVDFLRKYGQVLDMYAPHNIHGGSLGYAFVEFESEKAAESARSSLNGAAFLARRLVARPAKPR